MRLFYLQLRSFRLRFVFFAYGGGTVSQKANPISRRGEPSAKESQPILHRKQKRPSRISTESKKDQTKSSYATTDQS